MEAIKKYFLVLAYNGTTFNGWQNQLQNKSVQEAVEKALSSVFKQEIKVHGCGRTDAGVHATNYVLHTCLPALPEKLHFKLNANLPLQIAVKSILEVHDKANAQADAQARTYTYYLHFDKNPYLENFSTLHQKGQLNLVKMREACRLIEATKDFKNFCLNPEKHKSTNCAVSKVALFEEERNGRIAIQFTANHFLRSMIRLLVGELVEVGLGRTSVTDFESYLNSKKIKQKHSKALPQGLHLTGVKYAYFETKEFLPFTETF